MKFWAQRLVAAILGVGGIGLLLFGLWTAGIAFRASRAFESSCDDVPRAAPIGVWVRLRHCAVDDVNYDGHLTDINGRAVRKIKRVWRNPERRSPVPPSELVLAFPLAAGFARWEGIGTRTESLPSGLIPLPDTMGVVMGRAGVPPYYVRAFSESRQLALGAVILEERVPPTFLDAALRTALGLLLLGSGWWVHRHGIPAAVRRMRLPPVSRYSPRYQPRPAGHISPAWLLLPLFLVVVLFRGCQSYFATPGERAIAQYGLTPAAAPVATPTPPPAPTPEASLDQLIAHLPSERIAFAGTLLPDRVALIDALTKRANEAPERVRDALLPAIYMSNPDTRGKVLAAFRSMNLPRIPQELVVLAGSKSVSQRVALEAALALGARRLNPELLIAGSRNSETSAIVLQELRSNTDDASARVLARIWVDGADVEFNRLAYEREKSSHDISAAVLEIVLDNTQPETRRTQAAHLLGTLNEVGALPPLRTFAMTLAPGVLKQSVDSTIDRLDVLSRQGRTPRMRTLELHPN